jgi:hypothetical protein
MLQAGWSKIEAQDTDEQSIAWYKLQHAFELEYETGAAWRKTFNFCSQTRNFFRRWIGRDG